jgi:hypothetical protein
LFLFNTKRELQVVSVQEVWLASRCQQRLPLAVLARNLSIADLGNQVERDCDYLLPDDATPETGKTSHCVVHK